MSIYKFPRIVCLAGFTLLTISMQAATTIKTVSNLTAYDLVFEPFSQRIFAAVGSTSVLHPNCIVEIDPISGTIENAVFAGSDPRKLAVSDDGRFIYIGLDGAGRVTRYNVSTRTIDQDFLLGTGSHGTMYAEDIAVQPGNPYVIAVSRFRKGVSPRHDGVAIYDNGIMRPQQTASHTGANRIEFSEDPRILYGYNNASTGYGTYRLFVNEYGVAISSTHSGLISGFGTDIAYDDDRLYATSGRVVDTATMTLAGQFASGGQVAPDSSVRRTFFISGTTLTAYNQHTFVQEGQRVLFGLSGSPRNLIRWGTDGLAFSNTNQQVVIVQTDLVPPSPDVIRLEIEGPDSLTSYKGNYRLTAEFSDGVTQDVTFKSRWSTLPDNHTQIDNTGSLFIFGTDQPGTTTIHAEYMFAGTLYTASKTIDYEGTLPAVGNLVRLEIGGPRHVLQQTSIQLTATAFFDDHTEYDVTNKVHWSLSNTDFAMLDAAGLLTAGTVDYARDVVVSAMFGYKNVELETHKTIVVVNNPSQITTSDWPTYQANPQRTGYVPVSLNPDDFTLRWTAAISNQTLNPVTAAAGRVFVGTAAALICLDARDGDPLWTVSDYCQHQPTYAYGNLYLQVGRHSSSTPRTYLKAYTADQGTEVFTSPFSQQWSTWYAPAVYDSSVYIGGGYYGGMYGFDALSGSEQWFHRLPQVANWTPAVQGDYSYAYVGGTLYAVNRYFGTRDFTIPAGSGTQVPVLGDLGNALVGGGGTLYCLDLAGQAVRWQFAGGYNGMPAVADGVVYAVRSGVLDARSEVDGALLWSWMPPEGSLISPMIVTQTHVIACTSNNTYAIEVLSRESEWSYPAAGRLSLGNDTLYIAGGNGVLTAIATPEYIPAIPLTIEIEGPDEIFENSQVSYQAFITYDDGRVRDRTALAEWTLDGSAPAAFAEGTLTVGELLYPEETAVLYVEYTQDGITVADTKTIVVHIVGSVTDLISRNLEKAIQSKTTAAAELENVMLHEQAAVDVLKGLRNNRSKEKGYQPSVNKATSLVQVALTFGRISLKAIQISLEKLLDAMTIIEENLREEPTEPMLKTQSKNNDPPSDDAPIVQERKKQIRPIGRNR